MAFCPLAVQWGDVATWVAAAATVSAVLVALRTSRAALNVAISHREEEEKNRQEIRSIKATAYSAAIADDIHRALKHLELALSYLRSDLPELTSALAATNEMAEISTDLMTSMLQHVEVFGLHGRVLGRMAVVLMEDAQTGRRNAAQLNRQGSVPENFASRLDRKLHQDMLYLRSIAGLFYDMAGIDDPNRIVRPLNDSEQDELFNSADGARPLPATAP